MSTNHILNHTLAKEVARQVVELAAAKTELAEERRKREEAEKKLKEPIVKLERMPSNDFQNFHNARMANQQALGVQGRMNRYAFGFGSALGSAGQFFG
jgi:hypothetical protein